MTKTGVKGWAVASLLFGSTWGLSAQGVAVVESPGAPDAPGAVTAFVHVTVVPMDRESVLSGQTVLVRDGRIEAVGNAGSVVLPQGALVIEGQGRYLLPGLTDAHMHLDAFVGARPDFGDAPLYLANGVTTVFNLRGGPEHLLWRERIQKGQLLAPNLYTSGEFINEPRVRTPEEVEKEVVSQARAGYDMVKYHQVLDPESGRYTTTTWLAPAAFARMNEVARREHIPLLGHGPYNLGLGAALRAGESLAHAGEFNPLYFFPSRHMAPYMAAALVPFLLLVIACLSWGAARGVRRIRRRPAALRSHEWSRFRRWTVWITVAAALVLLCWLFLIPGSLLYGNRGLLVLFTGLGLLLGVAALGLAGVAALVWRRPGDGWLAKAQAALLAVCALALAVSMTHWVPVAWRSSPSGMAKVARDCRKAGIWVQSTLVIYDNLFRLCGPRALEVLDDPALQFLPAELQKEWTEGDPPLPPVLAALFGRYPEFTREVVAALHREGVPMMAGTDAMGVPMVIPGRSLHQELVLLTRSGFSPYEALRAATVAPAQFLGKEQEFGTIAIGRRADLLLVDGNPLEDVAVLSRPVGVMVRGRWLPRQELEVMLEKLKGT
jgi:hypothetical protein